MSPTTPLSLQDKILCLHEAYWWAAIQYVKKREQCVECEDGAQETGRGEGYERAIGVMDDYLDHCTKSRRSEMILKGIRRGIEELRKKR